MLCSVWRSLDSVPSKDCYILVKAHAFMNIKAKMLVGVTFLSYILDVPVLAHPICPVGTFAWTETRLFFGRDIGDVGEVTPAQWRDFATAEIIPRFGDGFTVLDASGYWRGEGCKPDEIEAGDAELAGGCEKTKLLLVQYPPSAEADAKLNAIARAYIDRFKQEAVMRSDSAVCTRFITPN